MVCSILCSDFNHFMKTVLHKLHHCTYVKRFFNDSINRLFFGIFCLPLHPGCSNILYLLYTKLYLFDSSEDQTQKPLDAQTKKNLLASLSALDVEDNILPNKHGSDISVLIIERKYCGL